jgi:lipoprotein
MKKQLLLTVAIAVLSGITLGCAQNKNNNNNQPTQQEAKKELSNEEIVKAALNNFPKDNNLELDSKLTLETQVGDEHFSLTMTSNIKIDEKGNILKDYSKQETSAEGNSKEIEHVFLKKIDSGYEKYDVVDGRLVAKKLEDDADFLSGLDQFFRRSSIFDLVLDKNYEKNDTKLTFSGKIKLSEIKDKFKLSDDDMLFNGDANLSQMSIPVSLVIDTNTNEITTITLDAKTPMNDIFKENLEKEKNSMAKEEYAVAKQLVEAILKDSKGEYIITRKTNKIDEIKFN